MVVHPMMQAWHCLCQCTGFWYLSLLLYQNNVVDVEVIVMTFEWTILSAFVLSKHLAICSFL